VPIFVARVVFEAEASGGGGSKAGGLPHPSLSPFAPLPLSILPKFSDKPVGGKVTSSDGEVSRLPPTNTTLFVALYCRRFTALQQQRFFDELAAILDRVAIYLEPVYIISDFNIRLDRPGNPHADQLRPPAVRLPRACSSWFRTDAQAQRYTLDAFISHGDNGRPAVRSVTLNLANKFSQCTFSVTEHYDLFSDLIILRQA